MRMSVLSARLQLKAWIARTLTPARSSEPALGMTTVATLGSPADGNEVQLTSGSPSGMFTRATLVPLSQTR